MTNSKKPELLAPAGSMTALREAARFGADAVYIGGPFLQLRAASAGFDRDDIAAAADYLHARDKKLYVTVNSFAKNEEVGEIGAYGAFLHGAGVDAVIVSDLGAIAALRACVPALDIHVSTQANCMNYATAQVYADMGAARLVPAREMSLAEIKRRCMKRYPRSASRRSRTGQCAWPIPAGVCCPAFCSAAAATGANARSPAGGATTLSNKNGQANFFPSSRMSRGSQSSARAIFAVSRFWIN